MKIPLRAGRLFRDGGETEKVAVVSESAARSIWAGQDPIGRRVKNPWDGDGDFSRVVGIVGDIRSSGLDRAPVAAIYRPYEQRGGRPTAFGIVVQTDASPQAMIGPMREVVRHADPGVPVPEIRPMDALIARSVQPRLFQATLISGFALAAVLLAAIGIYGVVAYSALQRRKEIGVRIALGADEQDIYRLVFQNGMTPVAIGLAIGLLAACFFARLLTSLLFQVRTLDALSFTVAPLVLILAAAAPCWLTARQAARIDPVDALRLE
jgi:ABC-type antimicrobial peptide transport system permease subunit